MRNGVGEAGVNVKTAPRSIRWDKGNWILDITDFPRSTRMLVYQLVNDDDVLGRIEAVESLAGRPADQRALTALIAAGRNDKFWAVRARAVDAVGIWAADETRIALAPMRGAKAALLAATRDHDARVRQEAVTALGHIATGGTVPLDVTSRLREIARNDSSMIVRGAALAADIRLEKDAAIPLAQQLMTAELWQNVIRTPALEVLTTLDSPEARSLVEKYSPAQ
jgi:HEAT repeat protein